MIVQYITMTVHVAEDKVDAGGLPSRGNSQEKEEPAHEAEVERAVEHEGTVGEVSKDAEGVSFVHKVSRVPCGAVRHNADAGIHQKLEIECH
mmetsp:Transcript_15935/g.34630  ORF Transcript_15935/g.34630 Transcript_15935/m.34630 type:complete len:92 (-) Transcript_15935:380-655(-)